MSLLYVPGIPESWNLEYAVEVDLNDTGMDVVHVDHDEVMYYQNQKNPTLNHIRLCETQTLIESSRGSWFQITRMKSK